MKTQNGKPNRVSLQYHSYTEKDNGFFVWFSQQFAGGLLLWMDERGLQYPTYLMEIGSKKGNGCSGGKKN